LNIQIVEDHLKTGAPSADFFLLLPVVCLQTTSQHLTAVLKIVSDILQAADNGRLAV